MKSHQSIVSYIMQDLFEVESIGSSLFEASEKESEWLDLSSCDILNERLTVGDLNTVLSAESSLTLVVKTSAAENSRRLLSDSTYLLSIYGKRLHRFLCCFITEA